MLAFARHEYSAFQLPGMDSPLPTALDRVCLPLARHGCSAERVQLSGCASHLSEYAYQLAGMDTVVRRIRVRVRSAERALDPLLQSVAQAT